MKQTWNVFLAIFFAGIVSLILELSLLREFIYVFGANAFSNSIIISLFLAGLAGGTYLGNWKKLRAKNGTSARLKFSLIQFLIIVFIVLFYVTKKYFIYVCPNMKIVMLYFIVSTSAPSLLAGLSYVTSVEILYHKGEKYITYIYAFSTLGSVLGGIIHGIFFVPFFGMKSTYIFAIVFAATALFLIYPLSKRIAKIAILIFIIASVLIIYSDRFTLFYSFKNLLLSKDTQFGVMEVWRTKDGAVDLRVNRIHQYYSYGWSIRAHKQWAYTTLEIVSRPCNVLLFGYGSGVSSAAFLESPLVKRVDTVENCLQVIEASKKFFPEEYRAVAEDTRSHIIIQDFRNYVRFAKIKYDIITLDHSIVDPVYSGYFTMDFFEQLNNLLNPNGVIALLGEGASWNTTSLSFNYIYKNINPETEPFIRKNVYFLTMEKIDEKVAANYTQIEKAQFSKGPIYSDNNVYGTNLKEMLHRLKFNITDFLLLKNRDLVKKNY